VTDKLKNAVQVIVEYFTGFEDGEDDMGRPYFVAHSDDLRFTTDGKTFEELLENIQECVQLSMEDVDPAAFYGVARDARVQLIMEMPKNYAKTA
jgi:hypothetical protein